MATVRLAHARGADAAPVDAHGADLAVRQPSAPPGRVQMQSLLMLAVQIGRFPSTYWKRGTVVWDTTWPCSSVRRTSAPGWAALTSASPVLPRYTSRSESVPAPAWSVSVVPGAISSPWGSIADWFPTS